MAFIKLILTAKKLQELQKSLVEEKIDAIKADHGEQVQKKWKHFVLDIKLKCKKCWRSLICCGKSFCPKTCYKLRKEGSYENYILKSVLGFVGGVLLTYILFIVFVFQLSISLSASTILCSILGVIMCVGMAFSKNVRCVVLLTVPQFFSKKGRQALLAYAFALALTGPARNTLHNLGILTESLACGQEQLKQAVKQIVDLVKRPFLAIKESIKKVVKTIKEVVKKIKEILLKIKRVIMAIVRVIKAAFEFLGKIINICNKELGTPFERCTRAFDNAITDCNAKLGPLFNWLCSITYIVKGVCYIVKIFDYVCMIVDFISDSVIGVVIRKVKSFIRHIKTFFYVRIRFSHSFQFQTNSTKSLRDVAKGIVGEINDRTRAARNFLAFMTSASVLFFIFIVFQTVMYRIRYLSSESFDNNYIYYEFRQIDMQRAKQNRETVLPLNKRESQLYAPINSMKLVKVESKQLSKDAMILLTSSVKLATHCGADYCLFWLLSMITYYGKFQSKITAPNIPTTHVVGNGLLADLLRAIVKSFQPMGLQLEIDTIPCLPVPIPPDYDRYIQILVVLIFCWILTILQPYGLRFRNYIMGVYHPTRQKERTIWLYNTLLRRRTSFLKFARRQLRRKFGDKRISQVSCKEWLRAHLSCWIFRLCLGGEEQIACMLCGEILREDSKPIKCLTPGCPGIYCVECFADMKKICPLCLSPMDYGDLSDLDEEKDSSGDEPPPPPKKPCRVSKWCKAKKDSDEEPLVSDEENAIEFKENEVDEASGSSSDYLYSYQYEKSSEEFLLVPTTSFVDVEMQEMPDYADMRSFHDIMPAKASLESDTSLTDYDFEVDVDIDNTDKTVSTTMKLNVSTKESNVPTPQAELNLGQLGRPIKSCPKLTKAAPEQKPLLGENSSSDESDVQIEPISTKDASVDARLGSSSQKRVDFIGVPKVDQTQRNRKRKIRKNVKDNIPFLKEGLCYCSDLEDLLPEYNETLVTIPKSTTSTSTALQKHTQTINPQLQEKNTQCNNPSSNNNQMREDDLVDLSQDIKEDIAYAENIEMYLNQYYTVPNNEVRETCFIDLPPDVQEEINYAKNIVPELDLTSITNDNFRNILSSNRFRNSVRYEEICECSPSSHLLSSTLISGLTNRYQDDDFNDVDVFCMQKNSASLSTRNRYNIDLESPSSMDSLEFEKQQKKLVKEYYKAINLLPDSRIKKPKLRHSMAKFFNRIFRKHKSPKPELPQHLTDTDESVEVQSYNYYRNNWENLCSGISTPTYPFESQESGSTAEESSRQCLERRIRGGESAKFEVSFPDNSRLFQKPNRYVSKGIKIHEDFSTLSLPANPQPLNTQDLLAKYFVSIEDLTPTKDPGFSSINSARTPILERVCKSSFTNTKLQENHQKLNESVASAEREYNRSSKSVENTTGSSSVLSENFCLELLGSSGNKLNLHTDVSHNSGTSQKLFEKDFKLDKYFSCIDKMQISTNNQTNRSDLRYPEVKLENQMNIPDFRNRSELLEQNYTLHHSWNDDVPQKLISKSDKIQQTSKPDVQKSTNLGNKTEPMCCSYKNKANCERPERDMGVENDQITRSNCCRCCQQSSRDPVQTSHNNRNTPRRTIMKYEEVWLPPPPPPPFRFVRRSHRQWSPESIRSQKSCCCGRCRACLKTTQRQYPFRKCEGFVTPTSTYDPSFDQDYEEYMDLQYQNQEEYIELVQELEETLKTRNRNRVKRAMIEFEERSRHNEPLEKPIIDYDESNENEEPIMEKINTLRNGNPHQQCHSNAPCNCHLHTKYQKEYHECLNRGEPSERKCDFISNRTSREIERLSSSSPSHWIRDSISGEWYKVEPICENTKKGKRKGCAKCSCGLDDCYYCE